MMCRVKSATMSGQEKIPGFQEFMLPLLQLAADGEEHTLQEAIATLSKKFRLSPSERKALLPSGKQPTVNNRIGWARTYLTKAGLLETTGRALFRITARGQAVLKEGHDKIDLAVLDRFPDFAKFRSSPTSVHPSRSQEDDLAIVVRKGKATVTFDAKQLPRVLEVLGI